MSTIRVLRNTGAGLPHFTEGQVADVSQEVADLLCRLQLAVLIRAVPEQSAIAGIPPESIEDVESATEAVKAYRVRQLKQSKKRPDKES